MDDMSEDFGDWDDGIEEDFEEISSSSEDDNIKEIEKIDIDKWIDDFIIIIKQKIDEGFDNFFITEDLFYCQINNTKMNEDFSYLDVISHPKMIMFKYKNCYFDIETPMSLRLVRVVTNTPYYIKKEK